MDHKLVISQEGADTLVRLITGISKKSTHRLCDYLIIIWWHLVLA